MYLGNLINKDNLNYVLNIGNYQLIGNKIKIKIQLYYVKKE